jgi:hypothetical protein
MGWCIHKHETREGVGGQKPKTKLLCQTAVEGGGSRWWGGSCDATTVLGTFTDARWGSELGGQNIETEHDSLVLGCIQALRGGGGCYVVIADWDSGQLIGAG